MTFAGISASAQCPDDGVLYDVDLTPAGPGLTGTFGCVYGGEFYYFTAVAGENYLITSCETPWDSQLTLRDDFGNFLAYDDDSAPCGNGAAEITWTATYNGQVKVQINEFNCTSNTICGDLSVTWVSTQVVLGCTDPTALNYNPAATLDNGTCEFPTICDCAGTAHTIGVLVWLGDNAADDGTYNWNG